MTLTGDEAGADTVHQVVTDGTAGHAELNACFVSLAEVEYITFREEGQTVADARLGDIRALPIRWYHSDDDLCSAAAKLKAAHKLSFADSFVAALARRLDATLIHKTLNSRLSMA